ncbi:MAG: hypothetical protein AAF206_04700 [Bacteroidota bacterium]
MPSAFMGKYFTIHRAGSEALKYFFSVAFFLLLIGGIGGAIVWFFWVRPLEVEPQSAPPPTEQVQPVPAQPKPPENPSRPEKDEPKPWEKAKEGKPNRIL